jgi:hypothetical protein
MGVVFTAPCKKAVTDSMTAPSLVILSAHEGLAVAQRLKSGFQAIWRRLYETECRVQFWDELFPAANSYFDSLARIKADFVVVLFTGDDLSIVRQNSVSVPRDNLVFELGFFSAKLPGRVILVAEQGIKVPTDYAGIKAIPFKRPSLTELGNTTRNPLETCADSLVTDVASKWTNGSASGTPSPPQTTRFIPITDMTTGERLVPVYRDVESVDDWFVLLEQALRRPQPRLDSKMLYFGPGAANGWVHTTKSVDAFSLLLATFNERILPLLQRLDRGQALTIVDLGVGDMSPGKRVLSQCLQRKRKLDYVAVDISYDMLKLAFKNAGPELAAVYGTRGRVIAVNTEFASLSRYKRLFRDKSSEQASTVFLLLGNTLGNEANELYTLSNLFRAMTPGDALICEYQAVEEELASAEELTALFAPRRGFFLSPFTSLLCPTDALEFVVQEDGAEAARRGIEAMTYEFVCRFTRDVELRHHGFAEPLLVPRGDVGVYIVRKYREGAMRQLFERSGFSVDYDQIVPAVGSEGDGPKRRRFGYLTAFKPEPP